MTVPVEDSFDFVVVGGGTAGNVVAGRLAENPDVRVLVIEAGVSNTSEISEITTPASAFGLRDSQYDWAYKSTMINQPYYERVEKPNTRGKVLGGSSSLNYYTWIRGSKGTFDAWAEYGGPSWSWDGCEEYFNKPATYHDDDNLYPSELSKIGRNGPLHVSHADLVPELHTFRDALTEAWTSKGQKTCEDIYSGKMEGLTHCVNSIYGGMRSTSASYLADKPNVTILSSAIGKKINFDDNLKATSVTVSGVDRTEMTFKAKYEIIVACGVFESPKLLMLSGIGPKEELARHGIDSVVQSEHVGQNLHDHPILAHVFRLKDGTGLDSHLLRAGPAQSAALQKYRTSKKGPFSSGLLEMVGLPRIDDRLERYKEYREAKAQNGGKDPFGPEGQPHFEIDFVPMFSDAFQWHFPVPPEGDWLTVIVDLLRPLSRNGEVKLNSANPHQQPYINLNFFSNELDILALREGVRFVDDILMTGDGMKEILGEDYPWPMPRHSDEAMNKMILERSQTGYHPCGTARLSKDIAHGVVDPELRVHGVQNLRVVDASIIPLIPDCRIQNAVYMIGEKGADMIKAAYPALYRS
ncbi:GMC family oxidoreductase [Aspergillus vadensis CBS 113365]|uniref:Oxidoreductase n=1 Tax=Aspergillus vadensis (strain CBS 113365 / IMI 142717 / IBT 24658) TaxID=1448311 RepID=A0A319B431_ASPVC|nr:oxidoreductase [Aspergillus vadensis CBS 113365]PYH67219.1 oxidoreductase [Aspergillus vadensis CBS 113365]